MLAPLALATLALAGAPHVGLPGGSVDGARVLGRTVPEVVAALGAPTSVERYPARRDLVYGPARRPRLEVIFAGPSTDPAAQTAWAILVADPAATVPGIVRPLARRPAELARLLAARGLRTERGYRCDARGCFATLFGDGGTRRVLVGVQHGYRYLGVQVWPNP